MDSFIDFIAIPVFAIIVGLLCAILAELKKLNKK